MRIVYINVWEGFNFEFQDFFFFFLMIKEVMGYVEWHVGAVELIKTKELSSQIIYVYVYPIRLLD